MAGLTHSKSDWSSVTEGLIYQYGFRLARETDGGGGLLIVADQPGLKNDPSTEFASVGTFIYSDANGDVGGRGRTVTKSHRWSEVFGNGYEQVLASDGMIPSGTGSLGPSQSERPDNCRVRAGRQGGRVHGSGPGLAAVPGIRGQ